MVTIHSPSGPLVISCTPPNRTCTFCASGANTRNVTLRSGCTHGYGAPGILSGDGLHWSGASAQHRLQAISITTANLISSPFVRTRPALRSHSAHPEASNGACLAKIFTLIPFKTVNGDANRRNPQMIDRLFDGRLGDLHIMSVQAGCCGQVRTRHTPHAPIRPKPHVSRSEE